MVSRDTTVHIGAVLLAMFVFFLLQFLGSEVGTDGVSVVVFLLVYGLVFGGSHLYLALRGDDGMVPVGARWRYLAMVAVLLVTGAVSLTVGTQTVGGIEVNTIVLLVAVVTLVSYFVTENISSYRESAGERG